MLGVCLLQQLENLSDQQALDELSFDIRWQYALGVSAEEAYLSRSSLVEFRRRLVQQDPEGRLIREVFDRVCAAGVKHLKISTAEQRLDSTLICSDIGKRGRLSLAYETLRLFVRSLEEGDRERLPEAVLAWYAKSDERWVEVCDSQQVKSRLKQAGLWIAAVVEVFRGDRKGPPRSRISCCYACSRNTPKRWGRLHQRLAGTRLSPATTSRTLPTRSRK